MDLNWLDKNGISTKDVIAYTGGEDKYISAVQRFFKSYESNRNAIEDLLAASDLEGYCIKVHSLKSNSKMIGANALSTQFEQLENASKNGDADYVKENTATVLKMYKEVIEVLRPIGEMETVKVAGELTADEARATADKLLAALDDFDDDLSAELAGKLMGYPFRLTQKQKLREAAQYIGDFMYDEAAELIREIIPGIE
ncbi:MAG: Hpt domain-containing protein [Lachnospiraceae bacterium]|nr:Hpt domain-containing protein [Lachnospiraceae bacterium]